MKQTRVSSIIAQSLEETEKEAVGRHVSQLLIAPTSTNLKSVTSLIVSQVEGSKSGPSTLSAKETTKRIDENATATYKSPMAIPFMRALTIKETGDHSSIQEEAESEKPIKATLPQVIPSLHYESQTGAASSSSPILEIGEIFQLVELKDGEPALLAKALELYPQLRLSRGQRTHPIIAFSYRVLVDILVMLATKTPYTLTASDRTTLEENLGAATFLGFDKGWIESVRAKVFGIDKSEVLTAEEKISVMEEELGKCDIAFERMQKKRIEAREKLALVQNEFEAVDTQLFDLLENRRNLVMKMTEFRKITSVKDRPFGI
ncbi:hypothetical protein QN277_018924 [Acacia crassicarpa]|uniref:MATH domain-containing protein n=1 Tax=Acacia crassicarpa TaxID=499986 RepID=A0AAE1KID6_9FABA|nr:hypothetical protein QN277_018924 [Acacia crassicarpa]